MIYSHQHLDLDAVASIWFYRTFVTNDSVEFRPANWDGAEATPNDVILDMDCGIKGERDTTGKIHACLTLLVKQYASPDDQQALAGLVQYVDLQDSTGDVLAALEITQASAVSCLQATSLTTILRGLQRLHPNDDYAVLDTMSGLFDALLEQSRSALRAEQEADQAEWLGQVAISRNAREFATMEVLFARGARAVVYVDDFNLGVVRAHGETFRLDDASIKDLVAEEPGWFFHPAGFMVARGTKKAPSQSVSQIDVKRLARAVDRLFLGRV